MLYNVDTTKQHIWIVGKDYREMANENILDGTHTNWEIDVQLFGGAMGIFVCLTCKKALESIYDVAWLIN